MPEPSPGQHLRIRAARTAANQSREEVAEAISKKLSTYKAVEQGKRIATHPELLAIEGKTGAPMWFLKYGWEGWREEMTPEGLEQLADELFPDDPPDG